MLSAIKKQREIEEFEEAEGQGDIVRWRSNHEVYYLLRYVVKELITDKLRA